MTRSQGGSWDLVEAGNLVDELTARPARVVGFDFPFCVPHTLLRDPKFASDIGYKDGAFLGWRSFNGWIAQRLALTDPLDFTPFAPWRSRTTTTWPTPLSRSALQSSTRRTAVARCSRPTRRGKSGS